jgi:glycine cleavage system aminomethyltransferase T/glycine/D-amino acid oxidase-like deaminating enzyme
MTLPSASRVVVIGGGVAGCSIAYHLTVKGWNDVVVLDRDELTSGATFHSAGLVGQLRSSVALTKLMMYGSEVYGKLAQETGQDPGWHQAGSLRLASSRERLEELDRQVGWSQTFGLPMERIGPGRAKELFPLLNLDGVLGAVWLPTDGYLDPSNLAYALATAARRRGAKFFTHTRVNTIVLEGNRIRSVVTDQGEIDCEFVVNAAGIWSNEIGRMVGVVVPVIPMAHQYLITKPLEGVTRDLPQMRDPDLLIYFRQEVGGLLMGGYERHSRPWGLDGIPSDFNHKLLLEDWERFGEIMTNAIRRVPAMEHAEITKFINGPEAFTPDGEFILGESGVQGFYVAAGFCAHGIAGAGGVGRVMAEWIVDGEPSLDLWRMDIRRFGPQYSSRDLTLARVVEVYQQYYDIHFPNQERQSSRPLRVPPTYTRLKELGCEFGEKAGWERPNWFAVNQPIAATRPSLRNGKRDAITAPINDAGRVRTVFTPRGWGAKFYSPAIEVEHMTTREQAGLFDETSFSKIEIVGRGALGLLQRLADNDVDRPLGTVIYTQMLNNRGGIECDLTITRLAYDRFLLITGTAFGNHDLAWIRRHLPQDGSAFVSDVTSSRCCLGLWGPRARDILGAITREDVSNSGFPYLTAKAIAVGNVPVLAVRVTYVGELGWELYAPMEYGLMLWDSIWDVGREFGLVPAGYRAIESLRLEKGYRYWSVDISPEFNPYEAGLGFCVKLDKGDFVGREALMRAREDGITRKLCCLSIFPSREEETFGSAYPVTFGGEPIYNDGLVIGRVTSGGYGFSLHMSIAYGYLPVDLASEGTELEVEIFGERFSAKVVAEPLYDPRGLKIKS